MTDAVAQARRAVEQDVEVIAVHLKEPAKRAYLDWRDGGPLPPRAAEVVLNAQGTVIELDVNLDGGVRSVDSRLVPGAHPPLTLSPVLAAADAVINDSGFRDALRRRGIEDLDLVHIDLLPGGAFGLAHESTSRIARAIAYVKDDATANPYAHPVEHLMAIVDLERIAVLDVEEGEERPIPAADGEYRGERLTPRTDLKPFVITQPEGASFHIDENKRIRWHRWSLVVGLDQREGLVLHDVRYDNRSILYRGSLAEMVVPYGEPDPMHRWRNYFDAGEVGLGWTANSLALGCDCVGNITYLDGHVFDGTSVRTVPKAICVHEEDAGTLWKHTDYTTERVDLRRGRRLVINSMSTVGNYEYAFRWYLYLDGRIDVEVELHGIVSTIAVADGVTPLGSNLIDTGLAAPHHQHLFCFRLDLGIDGCDNVISEIDSATVPIGDGNPWGNAFTSRATILRNEEEACRQANGQVSRAWKVQSGEQTNALGKPTSFVLRPGHGTATLLADPESVIARRAAFGRHSLWVTPFDENERYPAGRYPYQNASGDGLPAWIKKRRPLENQDVVLWYTAGITHFVKPEDWPIMPVHKIGFSLEPFGFFDRNPTLDLPAPDDPSDTHCASSCCCEKDH